MRIAWVGNSFIYFNDLPTMLAALLSVAGLTGTSHDQVAPGGQRFAGHAADERVAALLGSEPPWDVVVLQDNSGVPGGFDSSQLEESKVALVSTLLPMVPPTARLILYGTWGHLRGSVYEEQREAYPDFLTMQHKTTAGCEGYCAASERHIELAPVGDAFKIIYDEEVAAGNDPTDPGSLFARLYVPDGFHPSRLGSFLAARVFAHVLLDGHEDKLAATRQFRPAASCALDAKLQSRYGEDWAPREMADEEATRLQEAARRAVLNRKSSA